MADLREDDLFLVNRNDTSATVQQSELMAKLQDDDYMIVNREDVTYKITGADLIDSVIDPLTLTPVVTPTNPEIGELLTVDPNTAGGKSPFSTTYQWKYKEALNGTVEDYAGETASTYQTVSSDEGHFIACEVTVTDSRGTTATELSAFTSAVIKPPSIVKPSIIAPANGAGEMVQAESDEIVGYISENIDYSSRVSIVGPDAFYPTDRGPEKIFDGDPNTLTAVESSSASEEVEIVFDATGLNLNTDNENMVARSASGWTFKVTGSKGTAERPISSDPEGTPLPAVGILQEIRVKGNGANWMYLKAAGQFLVDGDESNVLTLASDKDLELFKPFDDVEQDSGHTPQTSAITDVETVPGGGGVSENVIGTFSVTYGNGKFVAIAANNASKDVMYSADGITWAQSTSSNTGNNWNSVTYGNGKFVAVAPSGSNKVMYSSDGISWTGVRASDENSFWRSVTYGDGKFVAVAYSGTNQVMYSTDGINWTSATAAENIGWYSVTYGDGKFVATTYNGTNNRVMYSTNGINWTSASAPENSSWSSVTYGDGKFVAVASNGTNRVMYSSDAINWTSASAPENSSWSSVTYGDGKFVAVAYSGTNNLVMYSTNGINWTSASAFENNSWQSVTYGSDKFVAVSNNGSYRVMYSYSGTFWDGDLTELTLTDDTDLANFRVGDVESTGNTITAIGPDNTLTVDGGTWNNGETVTGPATTPATGTVASTDPAANTMTLSVSDETYPKRWIVNQGKFVKGEETPSQDAAPEVNGTIDVTPETDEITGLENIVADYAKDISSGTGGTIANPERAFNNNLADSATGPNIIFTHTFTNVTSFRINSISGGDYKVKVNDTDITVGGSDTQVWLDCMSAVTAGTVDKVELYHASNNILQQYLYAVEVNGENLIEGADKTTLTLATDKDLAQFSANDDVTQDSGHTPQTSAITGVTEIDQPYVSITYVMGSTGDRYNSLLTPDTAFSTGDQAYGNPGSLTISGNGYYYYLNIYQPGLASFRGASSGDRDEYDVLLGWDDVNDQWIVRDKIIGPVSSSNTLSASGELSQYWCVASVNSSAYYSAVVGEPYTSHGRGTYDYNYSAYRWNAWVPEKIERILTLTDATDLENFRVGDVLSTGDTVTAIGPGNTLTVDGGTWNNGDVVTGPDTAPATGTVASLDPATNTITLSSSDESGSKRWIVNAGKTVLGPVIQVPSNLKLYSSDFASDPEGVLAHTQSDWQITLKTDTAYANVVSQSLNDSDDLTVWEPSNLEKDTAYRCRVRHKSNNVVSDWSDDSTFKTAGGGIDVALAGLTTLYTGNGNSKKIVNGIDLASNGGLVWTKNRDQSASHAWYDTERGAGELIRCNEVTGEVNVPSRLPSFDSDGYTIGSDSIENNSSGDDFVSWTFQKAEGYFDVVTWDGNGTAFHEEPHSLGSKAGMVIAKRLDAAGLWAVYHKDLDDDDNGTECQAVLLNEPDGQGGYGFLANHARQTEDGFVFNQSNSNNWNAIGGKYVGYVFADTPGLIKCGAYPGNNGTQTIDVGFEPQWVLIKGIDLSSDWCIVDSKRGDSSILQSHTTNIEFPDSGYIEFTSNGFNLPKKSIPMNDARSKYIYVAIAKPDTTAFYDENREAAVTDVFVKARYGVNPVNEPERAREVGIYPLTEAPEGYDVSHYEKAGDRYIARPRVISNLEQLKLYLLNQAGLSVDELRSTLNLPEE